MSTRWKKVVRDFWRERTRTLLVVLAIAMGIAGFTTVLASYAILTRALNVGYLATNPASATLRTDVVDDPLLEAVNATGLVSAAEARRALGGKVKVGPAEWRSLTLFVVKDYGNIRVSTLRPQAGAWPPGVGEILIERDALRVARTSIGETLTLRTTNGDETTLRVTGSVHDVGQAQARMENTAYGYIVLATLPQLGEEPYLDQLKILAAGDRFDEAHVRDVADKVRDVVERQGHPVRRMDVPEPGKHPHEELMGLLMLAMAGFGLFILILSGVLVINLLTALMASQIRQVGMMKAIGGTRWQIAQIYFGQALLLGAAAIVIALPIGLIGSRLLCRSMATFLNFDIPSFVPPLWVFALIVVSGVLVPLLSAAYPVMKGSGVSVREALADFGVARSRFGTSVLDRALAGVGGISRPLLLAIRNSFRRRARLVLTLITLAMAGVFFLSALNVRLSLIRTIDSLFVTKNYDLTVSFGAMLPYEQLAPAIRATPGVAHAEGWITTEAAIVTGNTASSGGHGHGTNIHGSASTSGDRFTVVALPPQSTMIRFEILEGRGLRPDDTYALVLNSSLASRANAPKVGDEVVLRMGPSEKPWRVVGIAREPFSPGIAYVSRRIFDDAGHTGMTNNLRLLLRQHDADSVRRAKAALDEALERDGIRATGSTSKGDGRFAFDQHMVMIYVFLIIVSAVLAGVGGLGLTTTVSLNVLERRREMGVLRTIGATPRTVWLLVVAESVVIGVLSWILAALFAWPVSHVVGRFLVTMMFRSAPESAFEPLGILIWLVISIALAALASFVPAWHASRAPIRESVAYE